MYNKETNFTFCGHLKLLDVDRVEFFTVLTIHKLHEKIEKELIFVPQLFMTALSGKKVS